MATITAKYLNNLRVECKHEASGATLITDAPVDNHGKGESFSPTDLCCTALGSCALTIIAIQCQEKNIDISGAQMEINKIMASTPRRIGKIEVIFNFTQKTFTDSEKKLIENAAINCPVCKSLSSDLEQVFLFNWDE